MDNQVRMGIVLLIALISVVAKTVFDHIEASHPHPQPTQQSQQIDPALQSQIEQAEKAYAAQIEAQREAYQAALAANGQ